jgi:hypothetical protein
MSLDFKKASQSFDRLSFKKRMTSVFHHFSNTISVIGRDEDIIKPLIRMLIYNFVMVTGFFYFVFSFWYNIPAAGGFLAIAILLFLYKYFYYSRQEMRTSWIIYQSITGHQPTYNDSRVVTKELKSQVRKIAWIDILMAFANQKGKSKKRGRLQFLIRLFLKGLEHVWDLVNHYLLPSVAVDKLDIKPAIENMKTLKDRVPATLAGMFGIDFLGNVVRAVVAPVYVVLVLVSLALGVVFHEYMPSIQLDLGDGSELPIESIMFTWIPLFGAIYFGKLFSSLFERVVTMVKVTYFTIFYTQITHPDEIADDLREQLVDYLKLDDVEEVDNLDEQDAEESQ